MQRPVCIQEEERVARAAAHLRAANGQLPGIASGREGRLE